MTNHIRLAANVLTDGLIIRTLIKTNQPFIFKIIAILQHEVVDKAVVFDLAICIKIRQFLIGQHKDVAVEVEWDLHPIK